MIRGERELLLLFVKVAEPNCPVEVAVGDQGAGPAQVGDGEGEGLPSERRRREEMVPVRAREIGDLMVLAILVF